AAAIDALFTSSVVNIDNKDQLVAATGTSGSYYGVIQALTLSPTLDPVPVAKALATRLVASGWFQLDAKDVSGVHVITLSSGSLARTSWFLTLSGDPRVVGQPVIAISLASPDIV
ncbi:MAG: hypothetical protein JWO10_775, partial [Microbacteriaceae bacterium]|nr:hypothetical protein [Microbacteriaceae bacterium]